MPPRTDERSLTQVTFRDFTGGLYELGHDRGVPPNGLLECTDCMPLPGGGLRAAWAWQEHPTGSIPTNRRVTGLQVHRGGPNGRFPGFIDVGLMTASTETNTTGIFQMVYWSGRGTTSLTDITTWTSGPSHSSMTRIIPTKFVSFNQSDASNQNRAPDWYYNVAGSINLGSRGVHKLGTVLSSTVTTRVYDADVYYLTAHQDRLVYARAASESNSSSDPVESLKWTPPSTDSAPATSNFLLVASYRTGNIVYMEASFPQDLFLLKQSQGGFVIQGDIAAGPLVREMITNHAPERISWGTRIPHGIAYMTETEGVWAWNGTESYQHLSRQFVGSPMTEPVLVTGAGQGEVLGFLGSVAYGNIWLFTPKGYIYDVQQNCWFRSSLPGDGVIYSQWSFDDVGNRMYGAGHIEPGSDLKVVSTSLNQANMVRAPAFQATLPIIDLAERDVELRRIEIFGEGFGNGGTWQLEITNDQGTTTPTETKDVPARAASQRFDVGVKGDWLKVRLLSNGATDASSFTGKSEAPLVERIVLWLRPRQNRAA